LASDPVIDDDASAGIVNLDVTLDGLPYSKLSADAEAKNSVVDVVARLFAGKLPKCNAFAQVVAHNLAENVTVLQVTLVPTDGETSHRVAHYLQSESGKNSMGLLLEDAMSSMTSLEDIATGPVTLSSLGEAGQDGNLQRTVAITTQGSSVISMGATTLGKGDVITIGPEGQEKVTVLSNSNGSLEVQPPLSRSYPTGTLVIWIPPHRQHLSPRPPELTAAPTSAPTSAPASPTGDAEAETSSALGGAGQVAQTMTLSNLPSSELDAERRAVVETEIREAYADALNISVSQVTVIFKSDSGRRLHRSAGSGERPGHKELRVVVEVPRGKSEDGLRSQIARSRQLLDSKVRLAIGSAPDLSSTAVGLGVPE
jgi:hypothetical protein